MVLLELGLKRIEKSPLLDSLQLLKTYLKYYRLAGHTKHKVRNVGADVPEARVSFCLSNPPFNFSDKLDTSFLLSVNFLKFFFIIFCFDG
jgi:hypothetical protein